MKSDLTFILLGILGIVLCCLNGCTLNTDGLNTQTGIAAITPPNPHPGVSIDANEMDANDATGTKVGTDGSLLLDKPEVRTDASGTLDAGTAGDLSGDEGRNNCPKGALYPCDTGLCPCP